MLLEQAAGKNLLKKQQKKTKPNNSNYNSFWIITEVLHLLVVFTISSFIYFSFLSIVGCWLFLLVAFLLFIISMVCCFCLFHFQRIEQSKVELITYYISIYATMIFLLNCALILQDVWNSTCLYIAATTTITTTTTATTTDTTIIKIFPSLLSVILLCLRQDFYQCCCYCCCFCCSAVDVILFVMLVTIFGGF